MITRALLLIVCFFFFAPAFAQTGTPIVSDSRIKTFVYNENDVFTVLTHYGYQSNIEFGRHEEIMTVSVGDRVAWQIVPAGRRLFVKAMEERAHTNMTVVTNKRSYQFDLRSSGQVPLHPSEELVYVVRFFYPDEQPVVPQPPIFSDATRPPAPPAAPTGPNYEHIYNQTYSQAAPVPPVMAGMAPAPNVPPVMSPTPNMTPTPMSPQPMAQPHPAPNMFQQQPLPPSAIAMQAAPQPPVMSAIPAPAPQAAPPMPAPSMSPYPQHSAPGHLPSIAALEDDYQPQSPFPTLPPTSSPMGSSAPGLPPIRHEHGSAPTAAPTLSMPHSAPPITYGYSEPAEAARPAPSAPQTAKIGSPNNPNFNYTFTGPEKAAPIKIYDDGKDTYFRFQPSSNGIPQFYKITEQGFEVPVAAVLNESGDMVVSGLASRFAIRRNGANILVFNENAL